MFCVKFGEFWNDVDARNLRRTKANIFGWGMILVTLYQIMLSWSMPLKLNLFLAFGRSWVFKWKI